MVTATTVLKQSKFVSLLSSSVVKAQTPLIINFLHELRLLTHEYYDDTGFLHTLNSNEVETWKIYNFRAPTFVTSTCSADS